VLKLAEWQLEGVLSGASWRAPWAHTAHDLLLLTLFRQHLQFEEHNIVTGRQGMSVLSRHCMHGAARDNCSTGTHHRDQRHYLALVCGRPAVA